MKIDYVVENDDGEEIEYSVPAKYEVCGTCQGKGTHVNPAIDGHGISSEEWDNEWSEDEQEAYMKGCYDVTCHECKGTRVVLVVDEEKANAEDLKRFLDKLEAEHEYERECRHERDMGY